MSKWVRLEYNTVAEIVPPAATVPSIEAWFGRAFAQKCVAAPDEVTQNWLYDPESGTFTEPADAAFSEPAPREAPPPESDSPEAS